MKKTAPGGGFFPWTHTGTPVPPAPTTVAACAAAIAALFTRTGHVDHDGASVHRLAVQAGNGGLGFGFGSHFHKAKTFGAACFAVHHHLGGSDVAVLREVVAQAGVVDGVGQVAHINFAAHDRAFR